MRVLIATGLYPPESGGPATYTKLLEERLPGLGFEVSVLPFSTVRHLPKGLRHIAYAWRCYRLARVAEVVYAQDTVSTGFPAALAAWVAGKKFLVRVPGDHAWEQAQQRGITDSLDDFQTKKYGFPIELMRAVARFVVGRATTVVVPSRYMQEIVHGWGVALGKIHVIYSSIALPSEQPAVREPGFLVVSSGRRVPWKHFDAIERVVNREAGWRFFLVEGMPREQALGSVKAADVFVLNSTYEGLSHALVEAMMLGTPIVATNVGGNPELVRDGVDGLLIPPGDDEALHAALKKIHDDPETARTRAASAQLRAQEFSIDRTVTLVTELLKTV